MLDNNTNSSKSVMQTFSDIPTPSPDAKEIVGLLKQGGTVTGYKLSDGTILSKEEGIAMAKQGGICGVGVSTNNGTEYLKTLPDATESNNLTNLPTVSE